MRPKPSGRFMLPEITVEKRIHGQPPEYSTLLQSGWDRAKRYRIQFKSRELALGEKNALGVEADNGDSEVRARNTLDLICDPCGCAASKRATHSSSSA